MNVFIIEISLRYFCFLEISIFVAAVSKMVNIKKRSDMFAFMIRECVVLSSITSVMMEAIAVAVVLVALIALCIRGKIHFEKSD